MLKRLLLVALSVVAVGMLAWYGWKTSSLPLAGHAAADESVNRANEAMKRRDEGR